MRSNSCCTSMTARLPIETEGMESVCPLTTTRVFAWFCFSSSENFSPALGQLALAASNNSAVEVMETGWIFPTLWVVLYWVVLTWPGHFFLYWSLYYILLQKKKSTDFCRKYSIAHLTYMLENKIILCAVCTMIWLSLTTNILTFSDDRWLGFSARWSVQRYV